MRITDVLAAFACVATTWAARYIARDFRPEVVANDETWKKFKCKGEQLVLAMKGSEKEAAELMNLPHAQSAWVGDLKGNYSASNV